MHKKLIVVILVLITLLSYIGYKSFMSYNYKIDNKNIQVINNIKIVNNEKVTNQNQLNLNFTLPDNYIFNKETSTYSLENKTIEFTFIPNILNNICRYSNRFLPIDYIELMSKNNLKNEVDLITSNTKINIFSSINKIKTNYIKNSFIKTLDIKNSISILDGLNGFKYNNTIYLFNNSNMHKVEFSNNYTEEEIIDILETFIFE